MKVTLTNERGVLRYEVPLGRDDFYTPSGSVLILVEDVEDGIYSVLWRAHSQKNYLETEYDIQWRGDFNTCLKFFEGELLDFESDSHVSPKSA
jgi:hypothetical protein